MDPAAGGWEDPTEDPDTSTPTDGWVTGPELCEILALEVAFNAGQTHCPRCSARTFTYGPLLVCSFGCGENLIEVEASG